MTSPRKKNPKYKRILLKLSGEALQGTDNYGINAKILTTISSEIKEIHHQGVEVSVVIGGGNIFRGISGASTGMDRSTADYMGMLATVINALALQDSLERDGVLTRIQTALEIKQVAEPFIKRRAIRHIEKGRVVIFAAGTGNPFFTTDTAATLRALQINADIIRKATKVDGVYSADPMKVPDAEKYERLSYDEVLDRKLEVMDLTAICLVRDYGMPVRVFQMEKTGALLNIIRGGDEGTLIE